MKLSHRLAIVGLLLAAIAAVTLGRPLLNRLTGGGAPPYEACCSAPPLAAVEIAPAAPKPVEAPVKLPRLVDLGAGKCIPCKMMAPILEELKKEYAGRMQVDFIDVWLNPDAGKSYGVKAIPTQIFLDAQGKELFRHVGFFAKADILKKWQELGVTFEPAAKKSP